MVYEMTTKMTSVSILVSVLGLMVAISCATAMSHKEWLCEIVHPELANCRLVCTDGKVWNDGCPTCACISSLCQKKLCPFNQRCIVNEIQTGQYVGQTSHVAVCQSDERNQPILSPTTTMRPTMSPSTITKAPATPREPGFLGSCDYQGRCDMNGNCKSSDSVCRQDGLCCKVKRDDYIVGSVSNGMARCMERPEVGQCRGLGIQYVFNKNTGKCESMMFGGCVTSANSFPTIQRCRETCEHPCQKPRTLGRCRASIPRYFFNEDTEACEAFDLGGCAGIDNYFMTPWDCETHCKGLKKKNLKPDIAIERGQRLTRTTTTTRTTAPISIDGSSSGSQSQRETLRDRIINGFKNQPKFENRGNPQAPNDGNIRYQPRPHPGRRMYTVDENGNTIFVNNPKRFLPEPTTVASTNSGIGGEYRHLGDRIRSAHKVVNNFERSQVNYNNPRSDGGTEPRYQNRNFETNLQGQGRTYQSSVDAIRRYLARH